MITSRAGHCPIAGGELFYEIAGDDEIASAGDAPALILNHAGVADHRMYDDLFAAFAAQFRVVRYDLRGFGRSRTAAVPASLRADLVALLDHLGIARAAIAGTSLGGSLALDMAVEFPDRVLAIIPTATGLSGYDTPLTPAEAAIFATMERLEAAGDVAALTELEINVWGDGPGQPAGRLAPALRDRMRVMISETARAGYPEPQWRPLAPPAADRIGALTVPTLVVWGDLDVSSVIAACDYIASTIPGARRLTLPGVAHMAPLERPAEYVTAVTAFLADAPGH